VRGGVIRSASRVAINSRTRQVYFDWRCVTLSELQFSLFAKLWRAGAAGVRSQDLGAEFWAAGVEDDDRAARKVFTAMHRLSLSLQPLGLTIGTRTHGGGYRLGVPKPRAGDELLAEAQQQRAA
jgi:DNA-binding response OmpR family regulator